MTFVFPRAPTEKYGCLFLAPIIVYRTIANITKLPAEHIMTLKKSLKGEKGDFKLSDLKNGAAYEYGEAYALKNIDFLKKGA